MKHGRSICPISAPSRNCTPCVGPDSRSSTRSRYGLTKVKPWKPSASGGRHCDHGSVGQQTNLLYRAHEKSSKTGRHQR